MVCPWEGGWCSCPSSAQTTASPWLSPWVVLLSTPCPKVLWTQTQEGAVEDRSGWAWGICRYQPSNSTTKTLVLVSCGQGPHLQQPGPCLESMLGRVCVWGCATYLSL